MQRRHRSRKGFSLLLELLLAAALSFFFFTLLCSWFERNARIENTRKRIREARDTFLFQYALLENGYSASEKEPVRRYALGQETVIEIYEISLPELNRSIECGIIIQKESGE